ncbi:TPA: GTP-binding protein [Candidatus Woesearchaeota archaeon]|nr:GTP-binding protein [Candidatus Woesearchaeota archaeon]
MADTTQKPGSSKKEQAKLKAEEARAKRKEEVLKEKKSGSDRIKDLEEEIKKTPYNKRTQHHVGLVKAKLAMLKEKEAQRGKGKGKTDGYSVKRSGDATVIMVGFPSAGKSSLLNQLTNANSPVGDYEFTTLSVIPGLLEHKQAKIQVLDVPGIVHGAASGRGRGKEVLSVMQNADLAMILVDTLRPNAYPVIMKEIREAHLRLNKKRPDVKITKKVKDGIRIGKTVRLPELRDDTIKGICKEFGISNADILIRSVINADDLIDVLEANKRYIPAITVLNKIDLVSKERLDEIKKEINPDVLVSASQGVGIEEVKDVIFNHLEFIRIWCKEAGKKADMTVPLILREGATIETMCRKLHKDFVTKFKFARVWGPSAKFDGQVLMLKHELKDNDVVELHIR